MKKVLLIISFLWHIIISNAQISPKNKIISGPMLGQVELRTATVWIEVTAVVKTIADIVVPLRAVDLLAVKIIAPYQLPALLHGGGRQG